MPPKCTQLHRNSKLLIDTNGWPGSTLPRKAAKILKVRVRVKGVWRWWACDAPPNTHKPIHHGPINAQQLTRTNTIKEHNAVCVTMTGGCIAASSGMPDYYNRGRARAAGGVVMPVVGIPRLAWPVGSRPIVAGLACRGTLGKKRGAIGRMRYVRVQTNNTAARKSLRGCKVFSTNTPPSNRWQYCEPDTYMHDSHASVKRRIQSSSIDVVETPSPPHLF